MKKVLVGGAFDLIHAAHVHTLNEAKKHGDYLIVSVLSDARIIAKKGESRPIIPEEERRYMVGNIRCVDEVVTWPGPDYPVTGLIDMYKPNVIVVSGDNPVDLQSLCDERGIELVVISRIAVDSGLDTSGIIRKIKGE